MATTQELLTAVEAEIAARLSGRALRSFGKGEAQFVNESLTDLMDTRDRLRAELAAQQAPTFVLADIREDV